MVFLNFFVEKPFENLKNSPKQGLIMKDKSKRAYMIRMINEKAYVS